MGHVPVTLVIYHDHCMDGMGAALAAYVKFGDDAEYKAMSYDDAFPEMNFFAMRDVFIVDFSFSADRIREIAKVALTVTVLDHHKSAMKDLTGQQFPSNVIVLFDMERSGA